MFETRKEESNSRKELAIAKKLSNTQQLEKVVGGNYAALKNAGIEEGFTQRHAGNFTIEE